MLFDIFDHSKNFREFIVTTMWHTKKYISFFFSFFTAIGVLKMFKVLNKLINHISFDLTNFSLCMIGNADVLKYNIRNCNVKVYFNLYWTIHIYFKNRIRAYFSVVI